MAKHGLSDFQVGVAIILGLVVFASVAWPTNPRIRHQHQHQECNIAYLHLHGWIYIF